jgi:hypothetical protein
LILGVIEGSICRVNKCLLWQDAKGIKYFTSDQPALRPAESRY